MEAEPAALERRGVLNICGEKPRRTNAVNKARLRCMQTSHKEGFVGDGID
jgi:hypothetical protein